MRNTITLQDQYVAKVLGYDQKGRNYYSLVTRAGNTLHRELASLGLTQDQIQEAKEAAYEVVALARACGAKSAEECICDDLNFDQY